MAAVFQAQERERPPVLLPLASLFQHLRLHKGPPAFIQVDGQFIGNWPFLRGFTIVDLETDRLGHTLRTQPLNPSALL